MSRIDFAYGATHRLLAACRTTARHVQTGHRLLVYCTDQKRLHRFDSLLWEFDPISFIPHTLLDDPLVDQAPVILLPDIAALAQAPTTQWLLNLDLACPPDSQRHARILEIVSGHQADQQAARQRWAQYRQAGHDVRGHQLPPEN